MMRRYSVLLLALLALLVAPISVLADSPTRYDNYTTGEDAYAEVFLANWSAQTFLTAEAFELDKVRLKVAIEGEPGVLTVSIRSVNATNAPNGIDLASGTLDDAYVTTSMAWYEVDIDNVALAANTTYGIVMRSTGVNATVNYHIAMDGSSGAYAGGSEWLSLDGGYDWAADTDDDYLFELWGTPVISVESAAVFEGYYTDGSWLIVTSYKNVYEPYYPASDPMSHFLVQLLSGSTVIAQTNMPQWGYKPVGIYMAAESVSALTWGSAYTIRIYGTDSPNPYATYTLTTTDWKGNDLSVLDSWCIATAHSMEDYYDTELVVLTTAKGEVLNENGGVMFSIGISGLMAERPDLFQIAVSGIPSEEPTWTEAYGDMRDPWYTQLGADIATQVNTTAGLVGAEGVDILRLLLVGAYAIVAILMIANGMNFGAFAVASPLLIFGYMIKVLPWAGLGVAIAILVTMAVRQLWWKST